MGLQTLLDSMEALARRECEDILAAAEHRARVLRDQTREDCARLRDTALADAREGAARTMDEAKREARADSERLALTHRQQVAEAMLEKVAEAIKKTAQRDDFGSALLLLIEEAMDGAPANATVRVSPSHTERCRGWLDAHGYNQATVEPDPEIFDGVLVTDPAGTFRVTNTLRSRYALASDAAHRIAARRLLEESG